MGAFAAVCLLLAVVLLFSFRVRAKCEKAPVAEAQEAVPAAPVVEVQEAVLIKERDAARWAALVAQVCAERAVRAIDQMAVACAECVISPARERLVRDIAERFFADQTSDVEEARRRAAGTGVVEVEGAIPAFAPLPTRTMVESIVAAW